MSRPYQFTDNTNLSSPLDRRPQQQPAPAGQPPSFKTDMNRAKTKKWIEAKQYSYEGDDWGDYDEDDEYGVDNPNQSGPYAGMRNVSSPVQAAPSQHQILRKAPSFNAGDERRAFSTGAPSLPSHPPAHIAASGLPLPGLHGGMSGVTANRQVSNTSFAPSATSDLSSADPRHRLDYSPTAEPPPLQSRIASTSAPIVDKPLPVPPGGPPVLAPVELDDTSPVIPDFVRPADIYKRMQEERQRQQTPTIEEKLQPKTYIPPTTSTPRDETSLSEESSLVSTPAESPAPRRAPMVRIDSTPPQLPSVGADRGFADDFWGSGSSAFAVTSNPAFAPVIARSAIAAPALSAPAEQTAGPHYPASTGPHTMVNRAFDEPIRSNTVVSKQEGIRSTATSELSRSGLASTSDIGSTSSHVNEPSDHFPASTPLHVTNPTISEAQSPHDASMASYNNRLSDSTIRQSDTMPIQHGAPSLAVTQSALPRRSLEAPSPHQGPAHSPISAKHERNSEPAVAETVITDPTLFDGATKIPSPTDRAMREADLAAAARVLPDQATSAIAASEHEAQEAFLQRQPSLPAERSPQIPRAESPTKGRVADLTNRFSGEVRRASPDRHRSVPSVDGPGGLAPPSPSGPVATSSSSNAHTTGILTRPGVGREGTFRPKLPGGWESFTTSATDRSPERSPERSAEHHAIPVEEEEDAQSLTPVAERHQAFNNTAPITRSRAPVAAPLQTSGPAMQAQPLSSDIDLTPTTSKHHLPSRDIQPTTPIDYSVTSLAALGAAGTAMGGAFGVHSHEQQSRVARQYGDVPLRPVYFNRTDSEATTMTTTTVPPTPLPKDDPYDEMSIDSAEPPTPVPKDRSFGTAAMNPSASVTGTDRQVEPGHRPFGHSTSAGLGVATMSGVAASSGAAALAEHERSRSRSQSPIKTTTGSTGVLRSPVHTASSVSAIPSTTAPAGTSLHETRQTPRSELDFPTYGPGRTSGIPNEQLSHVGVTPVHMAAGSALDHESTHPHSSSLSAPSAGATVPETPMFEDEGVEPAYDRQITPLENKSEISSLPRGQEVSQMSPAQNVLPAIPAAREHDSHHLGRDTVAAATVLSASRVADRPIERSASEIRSAPLNPVVSPSMPSHERGVDVVKNEPVAPPSSIERHSETSGSAPVAPLVSSSILSRKTIDDVDGKPTGTGSAAGAIIPTTTNVHPDKPTAIKTSAPPVLPATSALHQQRVSPTRPAIISHMSTDDSPSDLESDRLRKEIVRSLSPVDAPLAHEAVDHHLSGNETLNSADSRHMSVLPAEYDHYFNNTDLVAHSGYTGISTPRPEDKTAAPATITTGTHHATTSVPERQVSPLLAATETMDDRVSSPPSGRRYSWEDDQAPRSAVSPISSPKDRDSHSGSTFDSAVNEPPGPSRASGLATALPIGHDSTHSAAATSAVKNTNLNTRDVVDHPRLSGEGLHVINAEPGELPELGDTPISPVARSQLHDPVSPIVNDRAVSPVVPTIKTTAATPGADTPLTTSAIDPLASAATATAHTPSTHDSRGRLPYEPKLPSFREIMTIKTSDHRISTLNDTRRQWAQHDTGLSGWLTRTIAAKPEHSHLLPTGSSSTSNAGMHASGPDALSHVDTSKTTTGLNRTGTDPLSPKHRTTGSLGRVFSRTSIDQQGSSPSSVTRPSIGPSPGSQRASGNSTAKGKEILGKGVSGAKGLFAKGRLKLKNAGAGDRGDD